jgi:hypothetical protein
LSSQGSAHRQCRPIRPAPKTSEPFVALAGIPRDGLSALHKARMPISVPAIQISLRAYGNAIIVCTQADADPVGIRDPQSELPP